MKKKKNLTKLLSKIQRSFIQLFQPIYIYKLLYTELLFFNFSFLLKSIILYNYNSKLTGGGNKKPTPRTEWGKIV